eukprot:TRINITY_DN452_c0_g1_i1.p1 TRINITY_DN452_c0_g1~~TRINITY_DN452_c0_g1_i1.p1  ORF type:complete len:175 (-),score=34.17 TRINITY_DN452_c0_g1_i1:748-1272(-)
MSTESLIDQFIAKVGQSLDRNDNRSYDEAATASSFVKDPGLTGLRENAYSPLKVSGAKETPYKLSLRLDEINESLVMDDRQLQNLMVSRLCDAIRGLYTMLYPDFDTNDKRVSIAFENAANVLSRMSEIVQIVRSEENRPYLEKRMGTLREDFRQAHAECANCLQRARKEYRRE